MSNIYIKYESARGCDYDYREFEERLCDFVDRSSGGVGKLVELLVNAGALSLEDVYAAFKSFEDHRTVDQIDEMS